MKKIILNFIFIFSCAAIYAQSPTPLRLVNNTTEDMIVHLVTTGTDPFNIGCDSCDNSLQTNNEFQIDSESQVVIDEYSDIPSWEGGPPFATCSPCSGTNAGVCGFPVFEWLRFGYPAANPGIAHGLGSGCGNFYNSSFSQGNFTATWQVVNGEILVIFND